MPQICTNQALKYGINRSLNIAVPGGTSSRGIAHWLSTMCVTVDYPMMHAHIMHWTIKLSQDLLPTQTTQDSTCTCTCTCIHVYVHVHTCICTYPMLYSTQNEIISV